MNLSSWQLSSSVNFPPNCKNRNLLLSNSAFMVVKESQRLASSFYNSSTLCFQYGLFSWICLLKFLNSSSFSLFKALPMAAASMSLMNLLWYHLIRKRWAYGLSISSTHMLLRNKFASLFFGLFTAWFVLFMIARPMPTKFPNYVYGKVQAQLSLHSDLCVQDPQ